MVWLEKKYLLLSSSNLQKFTQVKYEPFLAKFRCPYCGDSQKNKLKTRGYLFEVGGRVSFKCHNCGITKSAGNFLKDIDYRNYQEYKLELLKEKSSIGGSIEKEFVYVPEIDKNASKRIDHFLPFQVLKKVSQLKDNHPAKLYIEERQIPAEKHHLLYYCPKYYLWGNHIIPGKFSEKTLEKDEARIVIPFIDQNGYVFGCTGRSVAKDSTLRYVTLIFDDSKPKIFGLDSVDFKKRIFVVEGPIDSMFLSNAVAMAGADVDVSVLQGRKKTMVYDNEPRNKDIVKRIKRDIDKGFEVCIWPSSIEEKDINNMVLAGYSSSRIEEIIDNNTFSGPRALLTLNQWKKVNYD